MANLFGDMDLESPQFGADVSSGGEMYPSSPPEVRIERPQPQQIAADVARPRSIMDRMRELAQSFVQPNEQTGMSHMDILGATLQDVGAGLDRRPGGNLQNLRTSRTNEINENRQRQLEGRRIGLAEQKESREQRKEDLKAKAYEQLGDFDFSPDEIKTGRKLGPVVSSLLQAGDHTTAAGLIKMVHEAGKSEKMSNQLNSITNRLKLATTKEQADEVLLDMPTELAKEHHSWLSGVVKSKFGDSGEKSPNDNELVQFVETKGRIRGHTIPRELSVGEAQGMITSKRSMQQQQINVTAGQNTFRNADSLRDEYNKQTDVYKKQRVEFDKLEKLSKMKTPASDISFIVQAAKADDPTSTVRETEAAIREYARSAPEGMKAAINKFLTGQRLTDKQRSELVDVAKVAYGATRRSYETTRKTYTDLSGQSGVDPKRVVGEDLPSMMKKKGEAGSESKADRLKRLGF